MEIILNNSQRSCLRSSGHLLRRQTRVKKKMASIFKANANSSILVISTVALSAAAWCLFSNRRTRLQRPLIKPPLRNVTPLPGEQSKIVYLTGINKETTENDLLELFSKSGRSPVEIDLSEVAFHRGGGRAWALFQSADDAKNCIDTLHQLHFNGCTLCARLELGVKQDGMRIADNSMHTAILRGIQMRRGTPKMGTSTHVRNAKVGKHQKKGNVAKIFCRNGPIVTYSHKSISVGQTEYPFPSGVYLAKLIDMMCKAWSGDCVEQSKNHEDEESLLRLLANVTKLGGGSVHKYAKELSEAFAMADAVERGIKLSFGVVTKDLHKVHPKVICYCLGDGKHPVGAAALALAMPNNWEFVAIDPLLCCGSFCHKRITLVRGLSQDYSIHQVHTSTCNDNATAVYSSMLSIAVACHSHAPLEEFWERMPSPKLCVAMACCAQYSELPNEVPSLEYDNFEVYSPKRRIKIFAAI